MKINNKTKIASLKKLIEVTLTPLINSDYHLLDIPNHENIGDHLIAEGEIDFLKENLSNYKCKQTSCLNSFKSQNIIKSDILLLHGGGNFGDIYPHHQNFKLDIIKKYPQNKIIMLPQTVYYQDINKLKVDIISMNEHQDLHVCARDAKSKEILEKAGATFNIYLLPDMAFCITGIKFPESTLTKRALLMNRVDCENITLDNKLIDFLSSKGYKITESDWPTFQTTSFLLRLKRKLKSVKRKFGIIEKEKSLQEKKDYYINMGVEFMSPYSIVATTRLHGMILAILMNKEIIMLDNSYGKLSSFYETWLSDLETIKCWNEC